MLISNSIQDSVMTQIHAQDLRKLRVCSELQALADFVLLAMGVVVL